MPLREDFRLSARHGYAVCAAHGVWRSLVARFVRDEEVVGSNPATPTNCIALKPTSWSSHDVGFCMETGVFWPVSAGSRLSGHAERAVM